MLSGMIIKAGQFEQISFPRNLAERVKTSWLYLGRNVLPEGLKDLSSRYGSGFLIADSQTWAAAGDRIAELTGLELETIVLRGEIHCDQEHLEEILDRCGSAEVLIALGSGTLNDLTRLAAHRKECPFWSVGTAPSMDGYLSANSSVISGGIKVSYPNITPPEGVIIDLEILETAPARMLVAGIGDSLAKITSVFDWEFDSLVRGGAFDPELAGLLKAGLQKMMDLLTGNPEASLVSRVTIEFLLLSSAIMQVFRSSQPASGGEHLVSHVLEMLEQRGKITGGSLHGEKAGLAFWFVFQGYCDFSRHQRNPSEEQIQNLLNGFDDWAKWEIKPERSILEGKAAFIKNRKEQPVLSEKQRDWLWRCKEGVEQIYSQFGLPEKPSDLKISQEVFEFAYLHGGDIRDRVTLQDWVRSQ